MAKIQKGVPVQLPSGKVKIWDTEKAPHPLWHKNNKNRIGFLYHPYNHVKGKVLQLTLKPAILTAIDTVWKGFAQYDEEAYVYDDPILFELNQEITLAILDLFEDKLERQDWEPSGEIGGTLRKQEFMLKIKDICLFLMKEDIYYRPRILEMMRRIAPIIEKWEPTDAEMRAIMKCMEIEK